MMSRIISKTEYHQVPPSHDPDDEVTSELSDPEDRVKVEVEEASEGSEELTEEEGLATYLWASSSHSKGGDIRLLSGQNINCDSLLLLLSQSLSTYLDMTFHQKCPPMLLFNPFSSD